MFLIHCLQMPELHSLVMWHQTMPQSHEVECGSGQQHARAIVRLWSCLSKRLEYYIVLVIPPQVRCWGDKTKYEKESVHGMRISHLWWFFKKQNWMWTFLAPQFLCLSWTQVILSLQTRSFTPWRGIGWSSMWFHHKLGGINLEIYLWLRNPLQET